MKNILAIKAQYAVAFICCSFILIGCSSIPIRTDRTCFDNHYRRIPYKVEGDRRVIDMFYTTNRNLKQTKDSSVCFGRDLSPGMTYGTLKIKVNPAMKLGKMLPRALQRDEIIIIQKVDKIGEDVFLKRLDDAVKASPHNSLMIVIPGEYDDFNSAVIKATYFMYLLDINTPVLLFDWPGNQSVSIGGYKKAQNFAVTSGPQLAELLVNIIQQVKPQKLWINASSTGCQIVRTAVGLMYKYDDISDPRLKIDHIVLTAPDIRKDEFNGQFKKELLAVARKVTIYVSSNDRALLVSSLVNISRRLGRQKIREPEGLERTKDALYLKSLDPGRLAFVDVTPVNMASFKHGYYLESSEFYDDFYTRILDKGPNVSRRAYLLKVEDGTDYWMLQGDR